LFVRPFFKLIRYLQNGRRLLKNGISRGDYVHNKYTNKISKQSTYPANKTVFIDYQQNNFQDAFDYVGYDDQHSELGSPLERDFEVSILFQRYGPRKRTDGAGLLFLMTRY
jgi:hypothetical protein